MEIFPGPLFFNAYFHNVLTWSRPIITRRNIINFLPCKRLVEKSASIMSVGQCWTSRRPCFTLSVIQKNLIAICLDLLEQDIFLFSAILCAPSLSFQSRLLSRVYLLDSMNYWNHILKGRYLLFPITSVSFELREFIFCLLDFTLTTPVPKVIVPPVWPFMSSCKVTPVVRLLLVLVSWV